MHELALMQSIMEALEESARENGISRIFRVKLVVGRLTAVLPAALEFAFSVLAPGPLLREARLEIEAREAEAVCRHCGRRFFVEGYRFDCPHCGGDASLLAGRELLIESYDGE